MGSHKRFAQAASKHNPPDLARITGAVNGAKNPNFKVAFPSKSMKLLKYAGLQKHI
jgi:hypothetical protein